jgi:hypothetical protein
MAHIHKGTSGKGMAAPMEQGHYEPSDCPRLAKGQFEQVGTFVSVGEMNTISPKATSVNSKSGKLQLGEN